MLSGNSFQAAVTRAMIPTSKKLDIIHYKQNITLSENLILTVLQGIKKFLPIYVTTIREISCKTLSNSKFSNGFNWKNKSHKFLLFIIFIEFGVDKIIIKTNKFIFSDHFLHLNTHPHGVWLKSWKLVIDCSSNNQIPQRKFLSSI